MSLVVRFLLPQAQNLVIKDVGEFWGGVLDVDAYDLDAISRARYRVQPYGATEYGIVEDTDSPPPLPSGTLIPQPDPYPGYLTMDELQTETLVSPTGIWDFAQTPRVNGVPLGFGDGGGGGEDPDIIDIDGGGASTVFTQELDGGSA